MRQALKCGDEESRHKKHQKTNTTCTAINACIKRRFECGSSPPLSALTGLTDEARNAGANPKSKVTPSATAKPKPRTRQSAGSASRAGLSGGLIMLTTNGPDHHANNPPIAAASSASQTL